MAKIEGIRIRNFRVLRDITLGKLWNLQKAEPLAPMTAVIGKNGVGKSTLFDAFGFLADCLKSGVEEACDLRGRGGSRYILPASSGPASAPRFWSGRYWRRKRFVRSTGGD
jgi:predicted ATPase